MAHTIVIGAGLAGLSAADALISNGRSVEVWEARDRVGGRTRSERREGGVIELGAQWLGPTQERMHQLVRRFGLTTFEQHAEGRAVLIDGDDRRTYSGTVPLLGPLQLSRLGAGLVAFRRMSAGAGGGVVDPSLDKRTLAAVLDGPVGHGTGRRVVDTALRTIFGTEPEELSAAWAAAYAHAAGGDLLDLAAVEGGAQQTRVAEGTQSFSERLVAAIEDRGGDVHLSRPVVAIDHDADGLTVTAADGTTTARGTDVIVAVPPNLVDRIAVTPSLPSSRRALQARMPMGATTKVIALYEQPFWRDAGLTGEAVLTDGPVQVTFDVCDPAGLVGLVGFVTGAAAVAAADQPDEALHAAVVDQLVRAFGRRASAPIEVVSLPWANEEWTGGCPVGNPTPGTFARYGAALRQPVGHIHWAGTETATDWTGYMEGAVESGRRAAIEVLAAGHHLG